MAPVDLMVNVYERTYRQTLAPGTFRRIEADNRVTFAGRWALINNVHDRDDAKARAHELVEAGELTGFAFVADVIDDALRTTGLPRRVLRRRGYFLDFGLAMAVVGGSPYVLGWDAETRLAEPGDWITPGVELLERDLGIFSAAPRWPARDVDTLPDETVAERGPWALNYGFSDQVFLVRRDDIAAPIYRALAPASLARHAHHPWTFEARLESYQRAQGMPRASHREIRFQTNDMLDVMQREGGYTPGETLQRKAFSLTRRGLAALGSQRPALRLP